MDTIQQGAEQLFIDAKGFYEKGDSNEALKILRKLEGEFPGYKNTYLLMGRIYRYVLSDNDIAEKYFKKALSLDNHYKDVLYDYANLLHSQNRYEDLKILVEQNMLPAEGLDRVLIFEYLGLIAEFQKKYGKAIDHYKEALALATASNNYEYYKQAIIRCKEKRSPVWYSMNSSGRLYSLIFITFFVLIVLISAYGK